MQDRVLIKHERLDPWLNAHNIVHSVSPSRFTRDDDGASWGQEPQRVAFIATVRPSTPPQAEAPRASAFRSGSDVSADVFRELLLEESKHHHHDDGYCCACSCFGCYYYDRSSYSSIGPSKEGNEHGTRDPRPQAIPALRRQIQVNSSPAMAPASDTTNEGVAEGGVANNGDGEGSYGGSAPMPKGSPPPYEHVLYANYHALSNPGLSNEASPDFAFSSASGGNNASFTNTFLRGILTSIDSKDPVVANAWLDTLLDAIDLLPPDVIKREIVAIAVSKGQLTTSVASRKSACRLLGKISTKLEASALRQEVLPVSLALCQDIDWEVRHLMCKHLALLSRGVGQEPTKMMIMPQLVELSNDEVSEVRIAAIETVVNLLSLLDDDTCSQTIVPLVMKSCDQAKQLEDETMPQLAHHLGRLCHGLMPNISAEQKAWFVNFYKLLAGLGVDGKRPKSSGEGQMPDLVPPIEDKSEMFSECRRECAYNFPAMVIFVGPANFVESLYSTFVGLSSDPSPKVKRTLASSLHELAKLVGTSFNTTKVQIVRLFHDDSIEVLDAMVANMVHVIDALARFGVLQFGQGGQFSADLSAALLHCEATVDRTRNWRLQADCLEKFSCLANCISPVTIQTRFIPLLFDRMKNTRTLPCKIAAARTLLVILRFTVKNDDRAHILFRVREELARANSCHIRMLYLRLCEMAIALFSKEYFKVHFFGELISLSSDVVANVRLKLCTMMPRLKALLSLPSDKPLLQHLEATVKDLLLRETDADVLFALQTSIQDLDGTETGVDGVPSMNVEEDRDNERKLREERLIASMEDQLYKNSTKKVSHVPVPASSASPRQRLNDNDPGVKRRSESVPPPLTRPFQPDLSMLARQTPEPLRTYSPELSVLKNDRSFFDFSQQPPAPPPPQQQQQFPVTSAASWDSLIMDHNNRPLDKQPYSSSLENLDPSAKEFLVDAGVILDNTNNALTTAASMPNLSVVVQHNYQAGNNVGPTSSLVNLEGEFSKYLISNAEMEQYEAEYKRCASVIANGSEDQMGMQQLQQQQQPFPGYGEMPSSMTTIPSTPPIGIQRQSRLGSPAKVPTSSPTSQSSTPTSLSVGTSVADNVTSFAQSTLSKLTSGSDIQGSIERLAEKWEAKRKSLIAVASVSFDFEEGQDETTEIAKQQRASIMEQKLQAIKQQGLPKKRSLLKPPTKTPGIPTATSQKRLSLTDQVEAVGQKAVHKFIIEPNQRRKSMEMMINFSDSSDERTSGESSSEEINGIEDPKLSNKLYELRSGRQPYSLPPSFPNRYDHGHHSRMDQDAMSTYVGNKGTSMAGTMANSQLVVKPIYSNPQMPQRRTLSKPPSNPPRSLPQPPRSLPMPPTFRQAPTPTSNSLLRAPSTSLLSNRSVYSVNKPNPQQQQGGKSQQQQQQANRQLPQPNQRPSHNINKAYFQPAAILPQPPSPKKSPTTYKVNPSKPVSPYIVSVNSPPESTSPEHSPTTSSGLISNSSGSTISTGSSSSQSSVESPAGGPKYTRVPPPRYRPHQPPLAQRRPLSSGAAYHDSSQAPGIDMTRQQGGGNLKQNRFGGKSASAESVMVGQQRSSSGRGYHHGSGGSSSRSSSPQSSNSESQLTPEDTSGGGRHLPDNSRQFDGRLSLAQQQGVMRRSSGLRMWQGHMGHASRSGSNQDQQNGGLRKQQPNNRTSSPSGNNDGASRLTTNVQLRGRQQQQQMDYGSYQQKMRAHSGERHLNEQPPPPYQRVSSLPGAYQMSSYAGQQQHHQHDGNKQRRPSSIHSSPGTSRASSPHTSDGRKFSSSAGSRGMMGAPPPSFESRHLHRQSGRMNPNESSSSSPSHRSNSQFGMHYSNNTKRQLQTQQQKQQQFKRAYSSDSQHSVGLPTPGFSSRLPIGTSMRTN